MDDLFLITYNNGLFMEKLSKRDFNVTPFKRPLSEESINRIRNTTFSGISLIEIKSGLHDELTGIIGFLRNNSAHIIVFTDKITMQLKSFLMDNGIADLIDNFNPDEILDYTETITNIAEPDMGKFLILDDSPARKHVLESIIKRFRYEPVFVNSIDEIFKRIEEMNIQMLLINLGTNSFDINSLSRRSYASSIIKKIAVIPYKDMGEGLFIHEMLAGLNRIADFILSPEELYSFLIDILFRKECSRSVDRLSTLIKNDNTALFTREPLNKIYQTLGSGIFSMNNILQNDVYEELGRNTVAFQDLLIRARGLKWLRIE